MKRQRGYFKRIAVMMFALFLLLALYGTVCTVQFQVYALFLQCLNK